jgi:hypothetical protein
MMVFQKKISSDAYLYMTLSRDVILDAHPIGEIERVLHAGKAHDGKYVVKSR